MYTEKPIIKKRRKPTKFELRWGHRVQWFAKREDCTCAAINMRVMNYGSPYMRKPRPTECEQIHRKLIKDIAHELGIHPQTVFTRMKMYGDAYKKVRNNGKPSSLAGQCPSGKDWVEYSRFAKTREWIMKEHPQYDDWKDGVVSWQTICGE
jgi:hypothetical protein